MGAVVTCQTMAMGSTPRAEVTTRYLQSQSSKRTKPIT